MKEIIKNKKLLIICSAILLIVLTIGIVIYLNSTDEKTEKKDVEVMHTMYVSINPLVKLTYKEIYSECINDKGETYICSGITSKVDSFELINDDAKEIYKDLNFTGKYLHDVLLEICDTATKNDVVFEKLTITSDSKNISQEELIKMLKENSEFSTDYDIYIKFEERASDSDFDPVSPELENKFIVNFDTSGGNKIDSVEIKKGETINEPSTPTKEGYNFVEWQLDSRKFDFDTLIEENTTLVAKWEIVENQNNNDNVSTQEPEQEESVQPESTGEGNNYGQSSQKICDDEYRQFNTRHLATYMNFTLENNFSPKEYPNLSSNYDEVMAQEGWGEVTVWCTDHPDTWGYFIFVTDEQIIKDQEKRDAYNKLMEELESGESTEESGN